MLHMLYDIILPEPFTFFSVISWLVTDMWQCYHDIILTLTLAPNKENKRKKEKRKENLNKEASVQASHIWYYPPFNGSTPGETC